MDTSLPTGEHSPAEMEERPTETQWVTPRQAAPNGTGQKSKLAVLHPHHSFCRNDVGLGRAHSRVYILLPRMTSPNPSHLQQRPFPATWDPVSITSSLTKPPCPLSSSPRSSNPFPFHDTLHFHNTTQVPVMPVNENSQFSWFVIHLLTLRGN